MEELKKIVGAENYFEDPETLDQYASDFSFTPPRRPLAVVKPKSADEVQRIVRWANQTKIPLTPVSSGPPRFRGDTIQKISGVIVDLSRMNRIPMVDRLDRVAMVEPGVRWDELQSEVRKHGMRVPMPLAPRRTKSVVGTVLEREPHIIPKYHLDHSEPLLCLEVIYGTGDLFRTGDAAGPGTIEEQWAVGRHQKQPMGIQMDEFRLLQCAQGSFGIVTWVTVRCEIYPKIQKPFLAWSDRLEDLMRLANRMVRLRLGDELFILNSQNLATLVARKGEEIKDIRRNLPPWILFFCFAGYDYFPEERVDYQEKDTADLAESIGVKFSEAVGGVSASDVLRISTQTSDPYWKLKQKGCFQDITFITSYHNIPEQVKMMKELAGMKGYPTVDMGVYIQPVCQGHGNQVEFTLPYNRSDPEEVELVKELYLSGAIMLMNRGAFFSRPYDLLAEIVFNRDAATRDALRKIKAIYDPNNIMNPGKLCF